MAGKMVPARRRSFLVSVIYVPQWLPFEQRLPPFVPPANQGQDERQPNRSGAIHNADLDGTPPLRWLVVSVRDRRLTPPTLPHVKADVLDAPQIRLPI
jgi:hypothetical protein